MGLVLERKPGDALVLVLPSPGGEVRVTVAVKSCRGKRVRVTVDAPPEVLIYRVEALPEPPPPESAAVAVPASREAGTPPGCTHAPDFREVHWYGKPFRFTREQAFVVGLLWGRWERGLPGLGHDAIRGRMSREGMTGRRWLSEWFRDHPAWDWMVVQGDRPGTYALAGPPPPPAVDGD